MQSRRQIQDLGKKHKKSKNSKDKSNPSDLATKGKKLKEEVVPHKLKIKKMFSKGDVIAAAGDKEDGSKDEEEKRKMLDAEISKGDIKMRS